MHRPASQVAAELVACIRCNECLDVCPALAAPLPVAALNRQTLEGPVSPEVARYAQGCILCGACVPVCPVGLHRDAMMLWLKMRLLRGDVPVAAPLPDDAGTDRALIAEPPTGLSAAHHARSRADRGGARSLWGMAPRGSAVASRRGEWVAEPLRSGGTGDEDW